MTGMLIGLLTFAAPAMAQTVTGISPDAGVPGGSTTVTITGSGFTGATEVDFGPGNSAPFTFDSDGQITATSPPGSGTVDVTVTTLLGGTSPTTPADEYTYEDAPTVTGVSTSAGPLNGGTAVTITGTNLTDATGVSFGTTPATSFTVVNSTTITTTSPGVSQAGAVDVTVTTPVATSAANPPGDQFSYDPVPAVTNVQPSAGALAGGTTVTISGSGFTGATAVDFGSGQPAQFTVNSDSSITATSPAGTGTVSITVTTPGGTSATGGPGTDFAYGPVPAVTSVSPNVGSVQGGASVKISGSGFSGATKVMFGSTAATFTVNSSGQITATSPAVLDSGPVDVTVTTPVATSDVNPPGDQFTYDPVPTVTDIQPDAGPLAGGTTVTISGSGFTGATEVDFGTGQAAQFTVKSDSSITATSPGGTGTVSITVTTPGGTSASGGSAEEYTYTSAPAVTGVSPSAGPVKGGASVTISGTGFTGATKVMFGSTAATSFKVNSDSQITAVSPPRGAGTVDVTVTSNDGTSATGSADVFTYDAVPTVSGVSPRAGPLSGGPTLTINGTGFTGAASVAVGANAATVLTVSSTQITATLTAATGAGTVNVTVTTPGGTSATSSADQFTYDPVPTVTGVSLGAGPLAGGTKVTITGTGLTGATAVSFGSSAGTQVTVLSNTEVTAVSPGGSAGAVGVTVTTPGGTSATADQFTYDPVPTVTGVSPGAGPLAGGTQVTITGTGLTGATAVDFAGAPASITVVSDTEVTAVSPGGSAGAVGVKVTTPGGTSSLTPPDSDQDFTYTNGPTITNLEPAAGPLGGGTTVTIVGTNLTNPDATNPTVAFGSTDVTPINATATSITVTSPASSKAGVVNIVVRTEGGTSPTTGTASQFSYDPVPTVTGITPGAGPVTGGTQVTVTGSGFSTGPATVAFGSKAAQSVRVISDTRLTATAPPESTGTIDISVTTPGGMSATGAADRYTFTPLPTPAIVKLSPSIGPMGGGTQVTIIGSKFTGATAVSFGAHPARSYTVDSGTEITAVSPPRGAGTVDVTITTPAGGTSEPVAAGQFVYESAPNVSFVRPSFAQDRATERGSIDPNGLPVTGCEFQYGTTGRYGHTAPCASPATGDSAPELVSAKVKGLKPGTKYHYRLIVTTASGTTDGPDWTFSTDPLKVVGTPLIGLLLERATRHPGSIGQLLGVQGISRAAVGESIVVRCILACSRKLSLRIHLVNARSMRRRVSLGSAFPLSMATRIEIDVSASGELSRYTRYSFTPAGRSIAVHITRSGCLSPAGLIAGCPRGAG